MKSVVLLILGILIRIVSFAQPLSGTYTIGGTSPNYSSFTAAVAALNTNGVNGPVTFNVRNGTYTESVLLTAVSGSSATNRITFQSEMGDSSLVILTFNGTTSTFRTNNARYLTIRKITVRATGAGSMTAINHIQGSNLIVENCRVSLNTNSSGTGINFLNVDSAITIRNCNVFNVQRGADISYSSGPLSTSRNILIENNTFNCGQSIYLSSVRNVKVIGNNALGSNTAFTMLSATDYEILENTFHSNTGVSCSINNAVGLTGDWSRISNNLFSAINSSFTFGAGIGFNGMDNVEVINNTFSYNSNSNTNSTLILINSDSVRVFNNIIVNHGLGYAYNVQSTANFLSNRNVIFTNGAAISQLAATLSQFQAYWNSDPNSVFVNPQFISAPTNLIPTNPSIDGLGIPWPGIIGDFANVIRHPQYPDPGAYEFSIQPNVNLGADITQCGGFVTLQAANNGSYYLWSTGATTQNITVNNSGTYWVQVNNLAGTDRDTISITINTPPSLSLSGNASICTGDSILLTATSPAVNLSWSPSVTLSSSTGAMVSAFPTATTTYTVTATDANNCSTTQQVSVTVNALPTVLAADADACAGQCAGLNASGALAYSWQPAAGLSNPGISNPLCCATASTNYTVTGTDANGCSNTDAVQFTVFALPVAIAGLDTSVCLGGSIPLSGSGGVSCSWTPAASLDNSNSCTPIASPLSSTAYSLTVTDANGCTNSDALLVTVHPLPSLPVIIQNGSSLVSSSTSGNQWYLNGNLIAGATDTAYTPLVNGNYEVVVTDSNGCSSASGLYFFGSVEVNAVNALNDFSVMYNSLSDELIYYSLINKDVNIVVYDLSGREVRRENIQGQYLEFRINISDIPKGFYFITIQNDSKTKVKQILLD